MKHRLAVDPPFHVTGRGRLLARHTRRDAPHCHRRRGPRGPGRPPRVSWRALRVGSARATLPGTATSRQKRRREEMRAYARRHYAIDSFTLTRPRVIVEHFTGSNSFRSAYDTFARDSADVELHELPGVCAHYVIDRDGTIHQLVPTSLMCRHTVGLNYTAIGIEHVGTSDAQVLGNRRQLRSSLLLTRMLQGRHGIRTRDVIGHNESLSSPYHRERVAALRRQTHGDFRRAAMRRYRRPLGRLPAPASMR